MAFDIAELRQASVVPFKSPIARPTMFEAYFTEIPVCMQEEKFGLFGDSKLGSTANNIGQQVVDKVKNPSPFTNVRFRVQSAGIPGIQVDNSIQRITYGPPRNIPVGALYTNMNIEVIESDQFDVRWFFDRWMNKALGINPGDNANDAWFSPRYFDDAVGTFTITAYAPNGLPQARWRLRECYPSAVNESNMNWSSVDQYIAVSVDLQYTYWEYQQLSITDILKDPEYAGAIGRGILGSITSTVL